VRVEPGECWRLQAGPRGVLQNSEDVSGVTRNLRSSITQEGLEWSLWNLARNPRKGSRIRPEPGIGLGTELGTGAESGVGIDPETHVDSAAMYDSEAGWGVRSESGWESEVRKSGLVRNRGRVRSRA